MVMFPRYVVSLKLPMPFYRHVGFMKWAGMSSLGCFKGVSRTVCIRQRSSCRRPHRTSRWMPCVGRAAPRKFVDFDIWWHADNGLIEFQCGNLQLFSESSDSTNLQAANPIFGEFASFWQRFSNEKSEVILVGDNYDAAYAATMDPR